ncbi:cytochrome b5 domain-containing protein [Patescibacteria group bacterium]|nr:cytochrome b5 domain-containing protein [Patescibacteria group bacterium]
MKNTAIIVSLGLIGIVGWFILMPHGSAPEPVVESTATTEQTSVETNISKPSDTKTTPTTKEVNVTPKPQTPSTPIKPTDTTKYYTSAEVSTHASVQSCWSIINRKVYDLTPWISRHPGGANAIKRICGVDGSADFNGQHGGQARPESELAGFFIGVLK